MGRLLLSTAIEIPSELLVGALVAIWAGLTTAIIYLYKDLKAVLDAQIKAANARAKYYEDLQSRPGPRRPQESYTNFEE